MRTVHCKWLAALVLSFTALAASAADVGVSIRVGDPNFYGRIDLGERYQPQVIYERPIVIRPSSYAYPPLYLRVPNGHARHWDRHCSAYGACGRPVYFVQDRWYRDTYRDRYDRRYRYDHRRGDYRGHGSEHRRDRRDD